MIDRKRCLLLYVFASAVAGSAITFFVFATLIKCNKIELKDKEQANTCNYTVMRLNGYKYIHPLLWVEPECEADKYAKIKADIAQYIKEEQDKDSLISASVYLRDFKMGDWMAINGNERYDPGSLLKVAVLITYLKMTESDPDLLDKEWEYKGLKGVNLPVEHYRSDTIVAGRRYKVRELLRYMITYSDNYATIFLENNINVATFSKVFTDMGMTKPDFTDPHYKLTVKEYSTLFKALYNAAYLDIPSSEYATSLLTESKFYEGLVKELPSTVTAAHKFGESGDQFSSQLHESGIIYIENSPYLLSVMTHGINWDKQAKVISHISRMVFDKMASQDE